MRVTGKVPHPPRGRRRAGPRGRTRGRVGSARVAASRHPLPEAHPRVVPAVARVAAGHAHPLAWLLRPASAPRCAGRASARRAPGMGEAPGVAFETTPGASPKKGVAYGRASNHRTLTKPHGRRSLSSKRVQSCPSVSKVVQRVANPETERRLGSLRPRAAAPRTDVPTSSYRRQWTRPGYLLHFQSTAPQYLHLFS